MRLMCQSLSVRDGRKRVTNETFWNILKRLFHCSIPRWLPLSGYSHQQYAIMEHNGTLLNLCSMFHSPCGPSSPIARISETCLSSLSYFHLHLDGFVEADAAILA
jgi:hypothetical protein